MTRRDSGTPDRCPGTAIRAFSPRSFAGSRQN